MTVTKALFLPKNTCQILFDFFCFLIFLVYSVLISSFRLSSGSVTEDGRYLLVSISRGCDPHNMIYYYDVQEAQQKITEKVPLKPLFAKLDASYEVCLFHF